MHHQSGTVAYGDQRPGKGWQLVATVYPQHVGAGLHGDWFDQELPTERYYRWGGKHKLDYGQQSRGIK